jgi:hypothetical protein
MVVGLVGDAEAEVMRIAAKVNATANSENLCARCVRRGETAGADRKGHG